MWEVLLYDKAWITFPKVDNDVFIFFASINILPSTPVFDIF